ncbi:MAG: pyrroline-5-carboxylate reductase [Clostridia bacterium]|nr:pyrroline-5-carboxylate reductase [Clostridia bacterium]
MKKQFGFIGCGNMGGALASAVAKTVSGDEILLCDANLEKAEALAARIGAQTAELSALVSNAQYIFLGVKPQGFDGLFETIRPYLAARADAPVLVSMAAGVSVAAVERMAGCAIPVIRIMPNTPVSVGEGMILYTCNQEVSDEALKGFLTSLSAAGRLDPIEEGKIDAASALSGCGPAFVYLFAEALADGAVECGLARDKANLYAAQTLYGAAKLLLESGKHPGELKDAVCSPGGTTIAGVHALEEGTFRAASMNAVTAAYEKTLQLKK